MSLSLSFFFLLYVQVYGLEPLIVAHRGASYDAPENTIPAFELAWKQGADAIEGDFHLTADGKIVCIHDADTKRVSGKKLIVSQSSVSDLRNLDVGSYKGAKYAETRIPTIEEVLATVPTGKKIYIEVKCGVEIIPVLLHAVKKSGLTDKQIVVISFNRDVIDRLKSKAPQFKAFWIQSFKKTIVGKVKPLSQTIRPSLQTVLKTLKTIKADGFSSNHKLIDEAFIQSLRAKGYEYNVWTVDDVEIATRFRRWGAKSITSNVPGYLRGHLSE